MCSLSHCPRLFRVRWWIAVTPPLILAFGPGFWLCIKTTGAYSRSIKSESLGSGLGSGHEYLKI